MELLQLLKTLSEAERNQKIAETLQQQQAEIQAMQDGYSTAMFVGFALLVLLIIVLEIWHDSQHNKLRRDISRLNSMNPQLSDVAGV